jgi:small multidrug resistance pump/quaternary ammonium compound-resistance protein SugE
MSSVAEISILIAAAAAFSSGGLCMKLSAGFTRPLPTLGVFALFGLGAALQTLALRRAELGVAYIFVLGAEAVLTLLISVLVLGESCPPSRLAAVLVVIAGIAWLRIT